MEPRSAQAGPPADAYFNDESLLAAVGNGSDLAFNTLIDGHQQAVRSFLRGIAASHADADDIAQETFLAAWTQAKSFRAQGSARAWLFSIAWRKAKGSQRRWFRSVRRDTVWHESSSGDDVRKMGAEERIAVREASDRFFQSRRTARKIV